MDDDEFDAVLCALTGCIPDCTVKRESLATAIRNKLAEEHGKEEWIVEVEPPCGYVVFDRVPEGIDIQVKWLDCSTPDALFAALDHSR